MTAQQCAPRSRAGTSPSPSTASRRRGMTLLEVMLSISVMTIAMVMFSGVVSSTARMGGEKRRASVAAQAARSQLEAMRCRPFRELWALYNEDPLDDPAGKGSAPGPHFTVDGLEALEGDADGFVGTIVFPQTDGQLVESVAIGDLGLPRDLNGDTLLDDKDHASDYAILPIKVRLEWRSEYGPRKLEMHTMIVNMEGE